MRLVLSCLIVAVTVAAAALPADRAPKACAWRSKKDWTLQSSAKAVAQGDAISSAGYDARGWHRVTVPNTVVGALVENGTYQDPYFGMNLRKIPGTTYPIGERFTLLPMPDDSPFKPSWWYRTEFDVPADRAGRSICASTSTASTTARTSGSTALDWQRPLKLVGVFRRYEFDVTSVARAGSRNAVAVEVMAPEPHDLSFMWVDWNPTPADKNMGLWGDGIAHRQRTGRAPRSATS